MKNKMKKEHPFLALPTEIRQQILTLSLPDSEILSSIELRATQSRDNIWQTNVWEVKWHCGALPSSLKNGTALPKPGWMVRLEESELFEKDREWVGRVWMGRVPGLGERKVRAWEGVFGRRFVWSFLFIIPYLYCHFSFGCAFSLVPSLAVSLETRYANSSSND